MKHSLLTHLSLNPSFFYFLLSVHWYYLSVSSRVLCFIGLFALFPLFPCIPFLCLCILLGMRFSVCMLLSFFFFFTSVECAADVPIIPCHTFLFNHASLVHQPRGRIWPNIGAVLIISDSRIKTNKCFRVDVQTDKHVVTVNLLQALVIFFLLFSYKTRQAWFCWPVTAPRKTQRVIGRTAFSFLHACSGYSAASDGRLSGWLTRHCRKPRQAE